MLVDAGGGVAIGIFLNNQLYSGTSGSAGEFGHTTIDIKWPLCICGNYGCLESSWIVPRGWRNIIDFRLDILGTKGKIEIEGDKEGISITTDSYQTPFVLDPVTEEEPIIL